MPPGFLPPTAVGLSDTNRRITTTQEIQRAIRTSKRQSAIGMDRVLYTMIDNTMKADAGILTNFINSLLPHSVRPPVWKQAKCVLALKPRRMDLSIPKNLGPISLLSCLGKTFEKIQTQRVAWARKLTGAISPDRLESRAGHLAIDNLMMTLTPAQEWLLKPSKPTKNAKGPTLTQPSILDNNIEGVFNCVVHEFLVQILTHYKPPCRLVASNAIFNRDREMCLSLDSETACCGIRLWPVPRLPSPPSVVHSIYVHDASEGLPHMGMSCRPRLGEHLGVRVYLGVNCMLKYLPNLGGRIYLGVNYTPKYSPNLSESTGLGTRVI